MKKALYFSILLLCMTSTILAQDITYGLKAGPNFANVTTSESEMNDAIDMRTAFHLGGVVEFAFTDQFALQTELLYSAKGYKFSFVSSYIMITRSVPETTINQTYKFDYINIPIMAKYYVAEGFSLQAGPQFGFLIAANVETEIEGNTETDDFKDNIESFDFGLGFGLGYKMENGIFADARYVLGLSNLAKEAEGDFTVKNGIIQVSIGYMF